MTKNNSKRRFLTILLIFFIVSELVSLNLINTVRVEEPSIKTADSWVISFIHVDDNWTATESNYNWCTGAGTSGNPYIIENVTIDAVG